MCNIADVLMRDDCVTNFCNSNDRLLLLVPPEADRTFHRSEFYSAVRYSQAHPGGQATKILTGLWYAIAGEICLPHNNS